MIRDDGKIDFGDITLISKNGEFLFQDRYKAGRIYAVPHDTFRKLVVVTAQLESHVCDEYRDVYNTLEFLLNQLEMNDELFQATMLDYSLWTISKE